MMTGDPLFFDGLDTGIVIVVLIKTVVTFVFLLLSVLLMVWWERKLVSDFQNRIGPNRAGPFGILQTLADGIKFFFKENILPERADSPIFRLAPYLAVVPAFLIFSVVPVGGVFSDGRNGTLRAASHDTFWQLADPPVGILWVLALSSIAVYGVMLAGWSSGSKYPLLGAVRASAQMVSYEAALGLSILAVVLVTGSLSTHDIVAAQDGLVNWNVVATGVLPFVVFMIASTAEMNRPPFDLVEAEQELVGGFNTEYSSIRFALFFLAEFMNVVTFSAIIVTLFFGGPRGPILFGPDWVWPLVWWFLKTFFFVCTFVWMRATLPRFRYDQLMDLGWKVLIPLSLGWLLLIAAIRIGNDRDWEPWVAPVGSVVFILAVIALLAGALRTSAERRETVKEVRF